MSVSPDNNSDVRVLVVREKSDNPWQGVKGDEILLQEAIGAGEPRLRLWVNAPALVIGRGYARRLPRAVEQVGGIPVIVRSSGGEVVIHGSGVLNVSLAVPTSVWQGPIHQAFSGLSDGVKGALVRLGWRATVGEIPQSYCPGDYDVAVDGRKVMGISQRRLREGILVHGSINVAIDPHTYAKIIVRFYEEAGIDDRPIVERIGTLTEGPAAHPADCPIASAISETMLEDWTKRTGRRWVEKG